ncbi:MAG: RnfABCDGE type electron transport complex subunit D [Bacillota bacterium]|nr:RnfABCDGE type electron transport complex subunit D [Bacillota bacterium]
MIGRNLVVTPPPHLKQRDAVAHAMRDVALALVPVTLVAFYFFRLNAVIMWVLCVGAAVLTEIVVRPMLGQKPQIGNMSAVVTGWLLALCFSPTTAWWTAVIGAILAVGVAKELMGGLGWNWFNPALFGRVVPVVLAPLFSWIGPVLSSTRFRFAMADVMSQATPLAMLKGRDLAGAPTPVDLLTAYPGGALGEVSALALIAGGLYLMLRKHISWRIPAGMIATVFVLTLVLGRYPVHQVLSGGLLLAAFFMATDWVTAPVTGNGRLIFGIAIGVLVVLFRVFGAPPEGVGFSVLLMNPTAHWIDRMTRPKLFGQK